MTRFVGGILVLESLVLSMACGGQSTDESGRIRTGGGGGNVSDAASHEGSGGTSSGGASGEGGVLGSGGNAGHAGQQSTGPVPGMACMGLACPVGDAAPGPPPTIEEACTDTQGKQGGGQIFMIPDLDCEERRCGEECNPCAGKQDCAAPPGRYHCNITQQCHQTTD